MYVSYYDMLKNLVKMLFGQRSRDATNRAQKFSSAANLGYCDQRQVFNYERLKMTMLFPGHLLCKPESE